jgi:hypothetical protein
MWQATMAQGSKRGHDDVPRSAAAPAPRTCKLVFVSPDCLIAALRAFVRPAGDLVPGEFACGLPQIIGFHEHWS